MERDFTHLTARQEEGVLLVTLHRPEAANALNTVLAQEITAVFSTAAADRAIRAAVFSGSGRHFCAGADLKERRGMDEAAWHAQHAAFEAARDAVLKCPVPVIAAVQGAAYAGGLELALACDFIYAAKDARFALTETTLGIIPGMGGTASLPRALGARRARELIYRGAPFSADQAHRWGLVNALFPPEDLLSETLCAAQAIAANAPLAVRAAKATIAESAAMAMDEALACELHHYHTLLSTADREEGLRAYHEKRKPVFSGT